MACDDEHMTSESGVIDRLEREGFTEQFVAKDGVLHSRDGVRGTLVDAFGAYADPDVAAFVTAVRNSAATIVPDDVGTPPGPPAPGADGCR